MNNYLDMPELMKAQNEENKKDRYIEITECMMSVCASGFDFDKKLEYANTLMAVIDNMDFQIYELYRALADRFVEILFELKKEIDSTSACQNCANKAIAEKLGELVNWGNAKQFLLAEWFCNDIKKTMDIAGKEKVELKVLFVSNRSVTFQVVCGGKYNLCEKYNLYLNGIEIDNKGTVVQSIYNLIPDREYEITVISEDGAKAGQVSFTTKHESVTLNVRDFGAVGDGETDDTHAIQTAIMNCPKDGRVLIPAGCFRFVSLFLKSNMYFEIAKDAELLALTDRKGHGIQAAVLPSTDGKDEFHFGSWEGNPLPMFSGILSILEAENVCVYGEGVLNGNASKETWWKDPKKMNMAYRPRLFFTRYAKNIALQGVTLKNSPSWTIHPFFSDDLGFYNVKVENPFDSPNTDGLDPESCNNIEIAGVSFSLGDDCIAVKAGKIYMGKKYKAPSQNVSIHNCLMQNGHGAVTIGSEMAGGVQNFEVKDCVFSNTDRGLRIKTRRGRGKDAILDKIIFRNIDMDHVMTPFVVNSFYFCDPDGKTEYVQSRELFPVDDRTPVIKKLEFENIDAKNCHVAGAYIEGLPELKIEEVVFRNVDISYAENPKCDVPAMSEGVEKCSKKGIFIKNVKHVTLDSVSVSGNVGEAVTLEAIDEVSR